MKHFESKKETNDILKAVKAVEKTFVEDNWSLQDFLNYIVQELRIPINITKLLTYSEKAFEKYLSEGKKIENVWDDDLYKLIFIRDTIEKLQNNNFQTIETSLPYKIIKDFIFDLGYIRGVCGYKLSNEKNSKDVKIAFLKMFNRGNFQVDPKIFYYLKRTLNQYIEKEKQRRIYLNSMLSADKKFTTRFSN